MINLIKRKLKNIKNFVSKLNIIDIYFLILMCLDCLVLIQELIHLINGNCDSSEHTSVCILLILHGVFILIK